MRKGLTFVAVSALVFILGNWVFGLMVDAVLSRSEFRFARLYSGRLTGDVIVLGNSRAVNGFCVQRLSELTKAQWVNLGYNGLGPSLAEALMLDYLDRYAPPRAVVLEISNIMQGNGSIRDCRLFVNTSKRLAAIDVKENGALGVLAAHVRTFAANGEMLMRCLYYIGRSDQTWVNEGRLSLEDVDRLRAEAGRRLEGAVLPESVAATKRLIRELRRRGIPVWCVVTPYLLTDEDRKQTQAWLDLLRDAGDEGVHYVNLSNAITDPLLFADPSHLNREGSIAFCDVLSHEVFKEGFSAMRHSVMTGGVSGAGSRDRADLCQGTCALNPQ